jgi:hypothetical protein
VGAETLVLAELDDDLFSGTRLLFHRIATIESGDVVEKKLALILTGVPEHAERELKKAEIAGGVC